jgi:hypothetical protein
LLPDGGFTENLLRDPPAKDLSKRAIQNFPIRSREYEREIFLENPF